MSLTEAEEYNAIIEAKKFQCAEPIIQEWLAEYIKEEAKSVFPDYQDNPDIFGFQEKNKHYNCYLVTLPIDGGVNPMIDAKMIDDNTRTKSKQVISLMLDAVYQVFPAVLATCDEKYKERLGTVAPVFDEKTFSFKLKKFNQKAIALQMASQQGMMIKNFLATNTNPLSAEQEEKIRKQLEEVARVHNENTKEVLDEEEEKCKSANAEIEEKMSRLFIVIEETNEDDGNNMEESLKRLVPIGLPFQDPAEKNYIDKLKEEHQVNE